MAFTHPLARDAKVWPMGKPGADAQRVLVVITTLALEAGNKKFKADKVEQLSEAASEWLKAHPQEASQFVLINRAKDW